MNESQSSSIKVPLFHFRVNISFLLVSGKSGKRKVLQIKEVAESKKQSINLLAEESLRTNEKIQNSKGVAGSIRALGGYGITSQTD